MTYPVQHVHYQDTDRLLYFLDTEFQATGDGIDLISIAVVCADGREFYRCNTEARLDLVEPWVRENVLPHLPRYGEPPWITAAGSFATRKTIATELRTFILPDPKPQLWAYYADYDHVALCELFGRMVDLPRHFPKYTMDLKQLSVMLGSPEHPKQAKGEHNALEDARWNRDLYAFLRSYEQNP